MIGEFLLPCRSASPFCLLHLLFPASPPPTLLTGLAGGSASGKTTVARKIIESLGVPWVSLLSMDSFYRVLTPEQHEMAARNEYNFDHPGTLTVNCVHCNSNCS